MKRRERRDGDYGVVFFFQMSSGSLLDSTSRDLSKRYIIVAEDRSGMG